MTTTTTGDGVLSCVKLTELKKNVLTALLVDKTNTNGTKLPEILNQYYINFYKVIYDEIQNIYNVEQTDVLAKFKDTLLRPEAQSNESWGSWIASGLNSLWGITKPVLTPAISVGGALLGATASCFNHAGLKIGSALLGAASEKILLGADHVVEKFKPTTNLTKNLFDTGKISMPDIKFQLNSNVIN